MTIVITTTYIISIPSVMRGTTNLPLGGFLLVLPGSSLVFPRVALRCPRAVFFLSPKVVFSLSEGFALFLSGFRFVSLGSLS